MNQEKPRSWKGIAGGLAVLCLAAFALFAHIGCANVIQSDECKKYVDCLAARDTQLNIQTDYKRFSVEGACWGSPEGADLCTRSCKSGSAWLKKSYPDLPQACQ
ncbi:MAG: hypothetical protein EP343_33605 [Deltaproteobacteria bacterium]|nr:MAG: hypothetical protein EP343_33605 [Deltaproteobacteria bacterium]